ncbi:MAG: ABC transporter ATP-binding protein [Clostridia bacterium]|nr:ABC transporter ATP-binding protein [Clostridia bacterium]
MMAKRNKNKKENDVVIKVQNLTKEFVIWEDKAYFLKEKLGNLKRNKKRKHVVLHDISCEINKGQTVALIGVNGSGKSTLLKLMTKIIYPEKGTIDIKGKISSLLELGAGFNTDFTGRENIYFNASMYGLGRKDVDKIIDKIIEFSELGKFIDSPVRTYSSGMYMRLAFSIAVNVQADVLLIDEILAVGDAHFQAKCLNKMQELKKQGKTMVFVSHNISQVKSFCDRAIWLKEGRIRMDGDVNQVLDEYIKEQG